MKGLEVGAINLDSVIPTEKFQMEKLNNTLPEPGIKPRTSCSVVTLASTRPTRRLLLHLINESLYYILAA